MSQAMLRTKLLQPEDSRSLAALGAALGQDAGAAEELQNQLVGLGALAALAAGTAVEAGLAVKKARSAG